MRTEQVSLTDVRHGERVTVWRGDGTGQGGMVIDASRDGILLVNLLGDEHAFTTGEIAYVTHEVPFDATECIEYSAECRGPVDYWHAGGSMGRSWPRCDYHGERRLARYEDSIERYADSDVEPEWFDESYAGERWDES